MMTNQESIDSIWEEIMEWYNKVLDELVWIIDNDVIMQKVHDVQTVWSELDRFLEEINAKKEEKKWFLSYFSSKWNDIKDQLRWGKLKYRIDKMMWSYKDCYWALKKAVEIQRTKWQTMSKFYDEMKEMESFLMSKCESVSKETFEEQLIYSSLTSLTKNIMKMNISIQQKISIMQWQVINSLSLAQEMWAWMAHFNSLLKDIMISTSIDNIIKTWANMMNTFREIIEKYNKFSVSETIKTSQAISDIRTNWIASIQYLQDMWGLIQEASSQFKALADKQRSDSDNTLKALSSVWSNIEELDNVQSKYMLANSATIDKKE